MNLEIIRTQTTWNDAAGSINSNYAKIADAIAQLKANGGGGGGGADIDLTDYATKVWVEAKGYITASALTQYALKEDIPSLVGYATEDFVNNQLGDYATKDYVTTKLVNYAPLTSVQGFENRIGGLESAVPQLNERVEQLATTKLDSSYFTLTNIKSTLGISDWALAATKPSYTAAEVGALSLGGGTINGDTILNGNVKIGKEGNATVIFRPNNTASHWFGVNTDGVLFFTNNGYTATYTILHSGNLGGYKLSQFTDDVVAGKYLPLSGGELNAGANISWVHSNSESWQSTAKGIRTLHSAGTMNGGSPSNYSAGLHIAGNNNYAFQMAYNPASAYVLKYRGFDANSAAWNDWKQLAFTDSNVASATKLQTARSIWGQSFDGTDNVSGDINNAAGGIYIHKTNEINSFNGKLYLNHHGNGLSGYGFTNDIVMVYNGGKVGIGTVALSEILEVGGNILASGNVKATSVTIGGVTLSWDSVNNALVVNGNMYGTGSITAKKSA